MASVLKQPFQETAVRRMRIGRQVSVSGTLYTGRDRLHKHLHEGGACPVDLRDGGLYHCGPVVLREGGGWRVTAAGPTTSMREEPYMADLIRKYKLRVVIGKGGMGEATRRACKDVGCVYLHAVGGAAAVLAASIKEVRGVHFLKEFGMAEAMWELSVDGLDAVVTIDAHGRSLHEKIESSSRDAVQALLA